jgi:hypothetical protein
METSASKNALWESGRPFWIQTAVMLASLWMMALAATAEGFPRPPISANLALFFFGAAILAAIWVFLKRWVGPEFLIVLFMPVVFTVIFDEITTTYKTPFILFCTLILSAGVIAYQVFAEDHYLKVALPLLLAAAILALLAARQVNGNFWAYTSSLHTGECFLDSIGCPPLPAGSPAWWSFFIGL